MSRLLLPLCISVLLVGTVVAVVTVQQDPTYRQDKRAAAVAPAVTSSPTAIPSPASFYAYNTIVVDESNNDHAARDTLYFTLVEIQQPGFLVISDSEQEQPGQMLGTSPFLMAGRYEKMTIPLSRVTHDGEFLFASLYGDTGDTHFNPATDTPLVRQDGRPAMISFSIEEDYE